VFDRPFRVRGRRMKLFSGIRRTHLVSLVGVCGVFGGVLAWQAWAERSVSLAYDQLQLGQSESTVVAAFGRQPKCEFEIGEYKASYFLPHGPRALWGRGERRCREARRPALGVGWSELPTGAYAAAFVVSRQGRVEGLALLGEQRLRTLRNSQISLTGDMPFCCPEVK
jgi:hypothetical protein